VGAKVGVVPQGEGEPWERWEERLREHVGPGPIAAARVGLCAWLREVFGNPFAPPPDPPPASDTVGAIARGAYDQWDFTGLPVLADALEEAGYRDQSPLAHLRGAGPHTRGCWALDRVLGLVEPRPRPEPADEDF
jgi:hypothetical protein